ncbi:MAG: AAA family ATPase [Candidatus Heimdallarchaeota archaeon]|nr:MAG: AAA family ATPase [Candidatus Heimdallarchaeota archaeon]
MPLIMILGLPGTGKTFFAKELSEFLPDKPIYLSTDIVRRYLFDFSHHHYEPFGEKSYTQEKRDLVYNALYLVIDILLSQKLSVMVDGTFYSQNKRQPIYKICQRSNQELILIRTTCSEDRIRQRIQDRKSQGKNSSDADFNIYLEIKKRFEPIKIPHLVINTEQSLTTNLQEVKKYIDKIRA